MTTTSSPAEDARGLAREPTARWILVLVAGLTIVWLGVLACGRSQSTLRIVTGG